jgi:hypothetical protein
LQDCRVWYSSSQGGIVAEETDENGMVYLYVDTDIADWSTRVQKDGNWVSDKVYLNEFEYDEEYNVYTYTFVVETEEINE